LFKNHFLHFTAVWQQLIGNDNDKRLGLTAKADQPGCRWGG